ncbi:hypothetical protein [Halalkalibacter okhensis]|uniref:hypothetical protein n=1 Tax=Halalkalibacter okhensis TaxID=333138 RepID=UPI000B270B1C|nr:hypothetical protein [Halalkalibacter okhensis]
MLQIILWLPLIILLILWTVRIIKGKPETHKAPIVVQAITILVLFTILLRNHPF